MHALNSRVYRAAEIAIDYFLLNVLWLIAALPIVTAYPATAALFGVIRAWRPGEGPGVFRAFVQQFRENLTNSLLIGMPWTAIGGILLANTLATLQLPGGVAVPFLAITATVGLAYALISLYLFPVIVNFHATPIGAIKNAALLALAQPVLSVLALIAMVCVALVTYVAPFTLLGSGVIVALSLSALADRAIRKLARGHEGPTAQGDR